MQRTADNPNHLHTTEWEDIQYQFGNRVGKYETHEEEILMRKAEQTAPELNKHLEAYDPEEEKRKDQEERAKDPEGTLDRDGSGDNGAPPIDSDDEEDYLEKLRRKRREELQKQLADNRFGVLRSIPGSAYVKEVTEDSANCWVVALLIQPGQSDCEALRTAMSNVAQRFKFVKFVSMLFTDALGNAFPVHHLPCVLLYRHMKLQHQLTGPETWKDRREVNVAQVERVLRQYGVLPAEESEEDSSKDDA